MEQKVPKSSSFRGKRNGKALNRNGLRAPNQLVRMRSAVRICLAAPKSLENFGFRGFFVAIFDFLVWVKMWVNQLTHTVTHTRKGLKSAGREVCASRPAFFSLPYITCAMKLPMVAAASSCFCRVAWV